MMFKFKLNNDIMEIDIDMPFVEENTINAITNFIRAINSNKIYNSKTFKIEDSKNINNSNENENCIDPASSESLAITREDSKPIIRDRLPNNDLKDLEQVSSKTTAHYNFMCPHCHQSMSILINKNLIIRDPFINDDNDNKLYMLEDSYKPINNQEMYKITPEELGMLVCEEDVAILANESLYGTCINCNNVESTDKWVDSYKNRALLTGNDKNCIVCGSELLYEIDRNGNDKIVCDNKECNFEYIEKKLT